MKKSPAKSVESPKKVLDTKHIWKRFDTYMENAYVELDWLVNRSPELTEGQKSYLRNQMYQTLRSMVIHLRTDSIPQDIRAKYGSFAEDLEENVKSENSIDNQS